MVRENYDIVIVGFSIAGSIAAKFAVENNASVLVLEAKSDIGENTIKSYQGLQNLLTKENVLEYFKKMGINIKPQREYNCCKIYFPPNIMTEIAFKRPIGYSIVRGNKVNSIDNLLAYQAINSGADVIYKSRFINFDGRKKIIFKHNNKIKKVRAKIIIGADGVNSRVAKLSGLANEPLVKAIGFGYHFTKVTDIDSGKVEGFLGQNIAPGEYAYIVPYKNEATIVTTLRPHMMRNGMKIKDYYKNFIKLPIVQKKLKFAKKLNVVSGTVSVKPLRSIVKDNIILVGDAARLTEPLLGFGIKNAILSGKIAGKTASRIINEDKLTGKDLEKNIISYEKEIKSILFKDLKKRLKFRKVYETINDHEMGDLIQLAKELTAGIDLNKMFETRETKSIKIKALKVLKDPYKIRLFLKYFLPAIRANYSFRN